MQKCKGCGQELAATAFWKDARRASGTQVKCIACMSDSHKRWRDRQSDKSLQSISERNAIAVRLMRERSPISLLFNSMKARAKKAGMAFDLTLDDIQIPEVCPVLGIALKFGVRRGPGLKERDCRPSVDRINNAKGYTRDNIIIVSYRANRIKSDADFAEIVAIAAFYGDLHAKSGRIGNLPSQQGSQEPHHNLPTVFQFKEEKERSLLERQAG